MKKVKFIKIIIVLLITLVIYEGYSIFNIMTSNNKNILSENIETIDVINNKDKILSIMVEQDNGVYKEETTRTAWPSRSEYMYAYSKCIDKNGKDLGDTTSYINFDESNYTAKIETNKTIYCILYFEKRTKLAPYEALRKFEKGATEVQTFQTDPVYGLYRYYGTYKEVTNNYICLGTLENPGACKTNLDHMYRIIGVTDGTEANNLGLEAGMLKVIKAISPSDGKKIKWASSSIIYPWDYEPTNETTGATARWYLNNTFYNGSTIDSKIKPYIAELNWWITQRYGDTEAYPPKAEYQSQMTSTKYRVGLMYASDYYNSWKYVDYPGDTYPDYNTDSWLNICHGLSSGSPACGGLSEWVMTWDSNYHYYDDTTTAWFVYPDGRLSSTHLDNQFAVRPVFYLIPNITLSGKGTESNPFVINP